MGRRKNRLMIGEGKGFSSIGGMSFYDDHFLSPDFSSRSLISFAGLEIWFKNPKYGIKRKRRLSFGFETCKVTTMKELDENLLERATERLVAEFQPEEVWLYGSHAWGNPHEDSDVDLLVVVPHSEETPIRRSQRRIGVCAACGCPRMSWWRHEKKLSESRGTKARW